MSFRILKLETLDANPRARRAARLVVSGVAGLSHFAHQRAFFDLASEVANILDGEGFDFDPVLGVHVGDMRISLEASALDHRLDVEIVPELIDVLTEAAHRVGLISDAPRKAGEA